MTTFQAGRAKPSHDHLMSVSVPGCSHPRFQLPSNPESRHLPDTRRQACGQDFIINVERWPGKLGPDERLFGVFDGHGTTGAPWSRLVGNALTNHIVSDWFSIKKMLRKGGTPIQTRQQLVASHIKTLFRKVEQQCAAAIHDIPSVELGGTNPCGGTTATVTMIMIVHRRRYIIQAAVGDSPGFLAQQLPSGECSVIQGPTEANGDNRRAVKEVALRHLAAGLPIPNIHFQRINGHHLSPSVQTDVHHLTGQPIYKPLPAWNYFNERGELDPHTNMDSYAILKKAGIPFGGQSLHLPEMTLVDGAWCLKDESQAASANYGNTIQSSPNNPCDGQNTTGFGDLHAGMACDCDASVHFYDTTQSQKPVLLVVCSDGMTDVLTIQTWSKLFFQAHQAHTRININWVKSMALLNKLGDHYNSYIWQGPLGLNPTHDDVSCAGVFLPAWTTSRRRRHR